MQTNTAMKAVGGRDASRERRSRLVQGKSALPTASNRTRTGDRKADVEGVTNVPKSAVSTPPPAPEQSAPETSVAAPAPVAGGPALSGREMSRARRSALVQGKTGLQQAAAVVAAPGSDAPAAAEPLPAMQPMRMNTGRGLAQALRAERARNGRGGGEAARPSGRIRSEPISYPPKVADSTTYAAKKVTGVRIGRGTNMTGDERGTDKQITGTQYVGIEAGYTPRLGGVKVGAARTEGGQVVTGTQVRSKVSITGDESNKGIRISGEADQEIADDVIDRRDEGGYSTAQFQRQHNPHGSTVFGTNLGRSAKAIGSRDRDTERAIEQTDSGQPISGTAVGRSERVTGDEPGSCRPITGDQYLMPAERQSLCEVPGSNMTTRAGAAMARNGRADPVSGEKVVVSEAWSRQAVTGVDVEHNGNVTGDEYGVCSPLTGTPYVGPGQYEAFCETDDAEHAAQRATPGLSAGNRITGDAPLNALSVTGTERGSGRDITGTPYYREEVEQEQCTDTVRHQSKRFSVASPQRDAHLNSDVTAVDEPTAEARITGTFTYGEGKITGNQEFHFSPRLLGEQSARIGVTGEGSVEGPQITGSAWGEHLRVTGTEDYIAAERNPSERAERPQAFAGASAFRSKARPEATRQMVTGQVGWTPKATTRITLSGGAQG